MMLVTIVDMKEEEDETLLLSKSTKEPTRCSACDSLFPSLMALEHHKEEFEHWSGDESLGNTESGDETSDDTVTSEELERLL
ncbi:hypothetical protein C0J52_09609 [Blattella germanica]|nr:hypothetical protein C0J52_09609 [Blattella germanica]